MQRSVRPLVITLVCVFAVCAIITGILFVTRALPDISGNGIFGDANAQPYSESWSLEFSDGRSLSVDTMSVNVDIQAHGGAALEASFEGSRSPDGRGELPYIEAVNDGNRIVLRERRPSDNTFTFSIGGFSGGALRGTLRVLVPQAHIGEFYADAFSGSVAASGIDADKVTVNTSSGSISLTNVSSGGDLFAESFSGGQTHSGLTAKNITLNASSGRIAAATLSAESLNMETFSGSMEISGAAVIGEAKLTASSGSIALTSFSAGSLFTEQFDGRLNLGGIRVSGAANLNTSSGAITGENASVQDLTFHTFSGPVTFTGLTSGSITGETSSGAVDLKLDAGSNADIDTFSGRVTLALPKNTGYGYTLDTFSGDINVDDGGAGNNITEKSKDAMSGVVGSGEYRVFVETSSGGISIIPG